MTFLSGAQTPPRVLLLPAAATALTTDGSRLLLATRGGYFRVDLAEPGAKDLRAVKAGRIIPLLANQTSASPAAVDGLEALHQAVTGLGS